MMSLVFLENWVKIQKHILSRFAEYPFLEHVEIGVRDVFLGKDTHAVYLSWLRLIISMGNKEHEQNKVNWINVGEWHH